MRALLLVVLLAAPAAADNAARPRCAPRGTPLVELQFHDETPHTRQMSVTLYANGTLDVAETIDGKAADTEVPRSCRSDEDVATIKAAIKAAPWTIAHARITCRARSAKSTSVKLEGRAIITEQICNAASLDETSAKKLAEIEAMLPSPSRGSACVTNPLAKGCN